MSDRGPNNEPDPNGRPLSQRGWLDPTAERADTGPGSLGSVRVEGSEEAAWTPGSNRVTAGGHLVLGQSLSHGPETGPGPQSPSGSPSRAEMPGQSPISPRQPRPASQPRPSTEAAAAPTPDPGSRRSRTCLSVAHGGSTAHSCDRKDDRHDLLTHSPSSPRSPSCP